MPDLSTLARLLRLDIIELCHLSRTSHIGSCLSCADILVAIYNGGFRIAPELANDPLRDRIVLSKGHCAAALYCTLARQGFFPTGILAEHFNRNNGLQEHPHLHDLPGVENASGSLGHGLPLGLGMALASRIMGSAYRVCVIVGDGECNEGSTWEAAMLAGAKKATNLCVVVDANRWQATGRSNEIMALEPLVEKWQAFGWQAIELDGHNPLAMMDVFQNMKETSSPLAVIARTVKGKGVSFMEDDNNWHYRIPNADEMRLIRKELGAT